MKKPEIRHSTTRKWPNRSPSNFARVTMSKSPTITQNFITMRLGVFDPRIREIVLTRLLFFNFSFVGTSDKLAPRLLHRFRRLIRQLASFRARMCLLGVPLKMLLIYGVKSPKNRSISGVNRQFSAKSQKSLNFDIIKTTEPILTKLCTMIKTIESTSLVVPRMRTTNPRWRTQPCNQPRRNFTGTCRLPLQTVRKVKINIFEKFKMADGRHIGNS